MILINHIEHMENIVLDSHLTFWYITKTFSFIIYNQDWNCLRCKGTKYSLYFFLMSSSLPSCSADQPSLLAPRIREKQENEHEHAHTRGKVSRSLRFHTWGGISQHITIICLLSSTWLFFTLNARRKLKGGWMDCDAHLLWALPNDKSRSFDEIVRCHPSHPP